MAGKPLVRVPVQTPMFDAKDFTEKSGLLTRTWIEFFRSLATGTTITSGGISWRWMGPWTPAPYFVGDVVSYPVGHESAYVCIADSAGGDIPDISPLFWALVAKAGADGATGATGPAGATGATGAAGPGVPVGGTAGQALEKIDSTDYNTHWVTLPAGLTVAGSSGDLQTNNGSGGLGSVTQATFVPATRTVNGHALSANVTVTNGDVGLGNVTNDAQLKAADLDTDGTLTANSDTKIASQKATKTYVDTRASSVVASLSSATFAGLSGSGGYTLVKLTDAPYLCVWNGSAWEYYIDGVKLGGLASGAGLSWVNQGGATLDQARIMDVLSVPANSGHSLRMRTVAQGGNFTAYLCFRTQTSLTMGSNYWYGGLVLRESGSGKCLIIGHGYDSSIGWVDVSMKFSSATAYAGAANYYDLAGRSPTELQWLKLVADGTNRTIYQGNGCDWQVRGQVARNEFFTTAWDQVGYVFNMDHSTNTGLMTVYGFWITTP